MLMRSVLRQIDFLQRRIAALEGNQAAAPGSEHSQDISTPSIDALREHIEHLDPARDAYLSPDSSDIAGQSYGRTRRDIHPPARQCDFDGQDLGYPDPDEHVSHLPIQFWTNKNQQNVVGDHVDGMGTVSKENAHSSNSLADRRHYFGTSSTISFVSHVQSILEDTKFRLSHDRPRHSEYTRRRQEQQFTEDYSIPTRAESDAMLRFFWSQIYPIYPYLDRQEFEAAYDKLWSSDCEKSSSSASSHIDSPGIYVRYVDHPAPNDGNAIPESRRFHVLLNSIYALVCAWNTSDVAGTQVKRAEVYRRRVEDLLERDFHIFNRPRLIFIQALLYLSLYLQSTVELTGMCWNIVGVAIRMSQALGLHRLSVSAAESSTNGLLHFLRWRTWAGCVLMDW